MDGVATLVCRQGAPPPADPAAWLSARRSGRAGRDRDDHRPGRRLHPLGRLPGAVDLSGRSPARSRVGLGRHDGAQRPGHPLRLRRPARPGLCRRPVGAHPGSGPRPVLRGERHAGTLRDGRGSARPVCRSPRSGDGLPGAGRRTVQHLDRLRGGRGRRGDHQDLPHPGPRPQSGRRAPASPGRGGLLTRRPHARLGHRDLEPGRPERPAGPPRFRTGLPLRHPGRLAGRREGGRRGRRPRRRSGGTRGGGRPDPSDPRRAVPHRPTGRAGPGHGDHRHAPAVPGSRGRGPRTRRTGRRRAPPLRPGAAGALAVPAAHPRRPAPRPSHRPPGPRLGGPGLRGRTVAPAGRTLPARPADPGPGPAGCRNGKRNEAGCQRLAV